MMLLAAEGGEVKGARKAPKGGTKKEKKPGFLKKFLGKF